MRKREIGIGILGYAGVAKAHLQAAHRLATIFPDAAIRPRLVAIAGRSRDRAAEVGQRYDIDDVHGHWRDLVENPRVQALINAGPNDLHAEVTLAAAARGLHVLCEKPLARTADEAERMSVAAGDAGIVNMTGYNYRFTPAVVLARRWIQDGRLGKIHHLRTRYCDDSMVDPSTPYGWRHDKTRAGSGVIGDLAAHAVDLARFLVGEIRAVSAASRIFVDRRPRPEGGTGIVDVEDALEAILEFEGGAVGTLEASTFCPGRKNLFTFEANGERGTIAWNLERLNELEVYLPDAGGSAGLGANGMRTVLVTDADHPYGGCWWPPGHILGWEHTFVHQLHRFLTAVRDGGSVALEGATFEDGAICARICDAFAEAAQNARRVEIPVRARDGQRR